MNPTNRLAAIEKNWDFDAHVEIMKEERRHAKDRRRYHIAIGVLAAIAVGVAGLGWHGLTSGDFDPVTGFWTAAGPILGTIIGYYFGKDGDDPG